MKFTARIASLARQRSALMWLVALTLLLELLIVVQSPVIAPDGILFVRMARDVQSEPIAALRKYDQHFGYPLLLLGVRQTLLGFWSADAAWEIAARMVAAFCGAAGVVLVWLLTRRIADQRVANLSALLYAMLPVLRQNAADALSDTPHVVLYLLSIVCVCYALDRKSTWLMFAGGAASGLAFLVRPEGLGVAVVTLLCFAVLPSWWRQFGWRKTIACAGAVFAGAALVTTPYIAVSGKLSGKITSKIGWPASFKTTADAATQSTPSTAAASAAAPAIPPLTPIDYQAPIAHEPWWNVLLAGVALFGERLGDCMRWALFAPLAAGAMWSLWHRDTATMRFLWLLAMFNVALVLALYCIAGYIDRRHLMPLVVLLLPTIASGLLLLVTAVQRVAIVRAHPRLSTALGIALLAALLLPRTLRPLHETHQHKLAAAQQLSALAAAGDTVLSNSSHIVYYAAQRGKIVGGVTLRNGHPEPGATQPGGHRFAVIEQGGPLFHGAWEQELDATYAPIATIAGDVAADQNDIVIYERRTSIAQRTTSASLR